MTLLLLTLWPYVYMIAFIGIWVSFVFAFESAVASGRAPDHQQFENAFFTILPVHLCTMLESFVLAGYYIFHVVKNPRISDTNRVMWTVGILFGGIAALPLYFWIYIWKPQPAPMPSLVPRDMGAPESRTSRDDSLDARTRTEGESGMADAVTTRLQPLVGLPLTVVRHAASMTGFHFGELKERPRGNSGAYVLHVDCPWRLEHEGRIYTGRHDHADPPSGKRRDAWAPDDETLQGELLARLLRGREPKTGSIMNTTDFLRVQSASGVECGGAVIELSGGYRLVVFPDNSAGESWRLMGHAVPDHFVIADGAIEGPTSPGTSE